MLRTNVSYDGSRKVVFDFASSFATLDQTLANLSHDLAPLCSSVFAWSVMIFGTSFVFPLWNDTFMFIVFSSGEYAFFVETIVCVQNIGTFF